MTIFRLAANEIRRLNASLLGRLALVAITLIPTIYAGLYLYANHDPYSAFNRVPAGIVVEDEGTTLSTGERLDAGTTVADDLVASHSFAWTRVDRPTAEKQVLNAELDFALVIPAEFSADLASSAQFSPRQAQLELLTNDANNYIVHTAANQVVAAVTKSVARELTSTAANQLLTGFTTIHANVATAVDGAAQLEKGLTDAKSGADTLKSASAQLSAGQQTLLAGSQRLASGAGSLSAGLATLDSKTSTLQADTARLADGARQVAAADQQIAATGRQVATAASNAHDALTTDRATLLSRLQQAGLTQAQLDAVGAELDRVAVPLGAANTQVQQTSSQLNQLQAGAQQVSDGAAALAAAAGPLREGIVSAASGSAKVKTGANQLVAGQQQAADGAAQLATGATDLDDGIGTLLAGATSLHSGLANGLEQIPNPSAQQRQAVAETLGNPVGVTNVSQSSAGTYGGGLAPFFLSLALWIGAYVLFLLVRPFSPRALAANQPSLRVALGGWLVPAAVGAAQAFVAFAVVVGVLRIDVANPLATLGFMCLVSVTFVGLVHMLVANLGTVGKFLGLVLLVLQLVTAAGTFPWQTLPGPLQPIHQIAPMSYAIDGIRRLMYGADPARLTTDAAVLLAYLAAAIALSTFAARRQRVWSPRRLKPEISI